MKTIKVMRDGRPATAEELQCAVEGKPLPPSDCSVKPCPFCGREVVRTETGESNVHFVFCRYCHAHGPQGDTDQSAIEYWNMRSPNNLIGRKDFLAIG